MRDCVTKLHGNLIFKALLGIRKSFNFINFDLEKNVLASSPTHPFTG